MPLRIIDNNKKIIKFRETNEGAVLTKGKRQVYLLYKSVNASKKAKEIVSKNSFNKLFSKGRKIRQLGNNVSYLDID